MAMPTLSPWPTTTPTPNSTHRPISTLRSTASAKLSYSEATPTPTPKYTAPTFPPEIWRRHLRPKCTALKSPPEIHRAGILARNPRRRNPRPRYTAPASSPEIHGTEIHHAGIPAQNMRLRTSARLHAHPPGSVGTHLSPHTRQIPRYSTTILETLQNALRVASGREHSPDSTCTRLRTLQLA